jgi:hypothetical protein
LRDKAEEADEAVGIDLIIPFSLSLEDWPRDKKK